MADFDEAIRLEPKLTQALNSRALTREKSGDFIGARADYKAVLAVDASDQTAIEGLKRLGE
jgi:predicted TPR repeat methyltransferase